MNDKLFNPDYLYSLCKNYGLQPSKKYGQNYLVNPEILEKIIEAGDLGKTDTVVEVGPGFGVLTFALAERVKRVVAFEIEKKIFKYWEDRKPKNLEIIWDNILKQAKKFPAGDYKVVANLPYQITSAVIRPFFEAENPPESMTLMVQKEVAERICAKPGDMSLLSVAVQYYADAEIVDHVARENFWPEPKVDSAIIKLSLRSDREHTIVIPAEAGIQSCVIPGEVAGSPRKNFFRLVKSGFASRRKLLIKNILPIIGKKNRELLKKIFADIGLKETARAQELSVEQWIRLTEGMREFSG